jgi:hypothetical protein
MTHPNNFIYKISIFFTLLFYIRHSIPFLHFFFYSCILNSSVPKEPPSLPLSVLPLYFLSYPLWRASMSTTSILKSNGCTIAQRSDSPTPRAGLRALVWRDTNSRVSYQNNLSSLMARNPYQHGKVDSNGYLVVSLSSVFFNPSHPL